MFYETKNFKIITEKSQIPWLVVYAKDKYKELSELDKDLYFELLSLVRELELAMLEFYKPDKINIASFANYLPQVHIHIMARFKTDAFFPECMWGKPQREAKDLGLKSLDEFKEYFTSTYRKIL